MKMANISVYKRKIGNINYDTALTIINCFVHIILGSVAFSPIFAPFGISYLCANITNKNKKLFFACSLLGIALFSVSKIKYITIAIIFFIITSFISKKHSARPLTLSIVLAIITFAVSTVQLLFIGFVSYDFFIYLTECFLVAILSQIFMRGTNVIKRKFYAISDEEIVGISTIMACLIGSMSGINFGGIYISTILAMYVVMLLASTGQISISAVVGISLGTIIALTQNALPVLATTFGVMGALCGVFSVFGALGVMIGGIFVIVAFGSFYGTSEIWISILYGISASALLALTPKNIIERIKNLKPTINVFDPNKGHIIKQREQILEKLKTLSSTLRELSKPCMHADYVLLEQYYKRVIKGVCSKCSMYELCYKQKGDDTYKLLQSLYNEIELNGGVFVRDIIYNKGHKCIHIDDLVMYAKDMFEIHKKEIARNKLTHLQETTIKNQYENLAQVIDGYSILSADVFSDYSTTSMEVAKALHRVGLNVQGVNILKNAYGKTEVTTEFIGESNINVKNVISNIINTNMQQTNTVVLGDKVRVTLTEGYAFSVDIGKCCMDKYAKQTPGDSTIWFDTPQGKKYVVLSDGMGTGPQASKDSHYIVDLFKKLILAGFDPDVAIKTINTNLNLSKTDERCHTIDILEINMINGKARMFKSGAVGTVLYMDGKTHYLHWSSMPLGILDITMVDIKHIDIQDNAVFVLISDGVIDNIINGINGEVLVQNVLEIYKDHEVCEIADNIIMTALASGTLKDDMTALVVKINKN